jgi:hypothetical protein
MRATSRGCPQFERTPILNTLQRARVCEQEDKMTKSLLPALTFTLIATAAVAQVGPPTSQRTCSANRQLVLREGAVVLDTSPSTYARFVKSGAECLVGQFPEPSWVPSSNNPQCFIGYRCRDSSDDY